MNDDFPADELATLRQLVQKLSDERGDPPGDPMVPARPPEIPPELRDGVALPLPHEDTK